MERRSFLAMACGALAGVFGWKPRAKQPPMLYDHADAMGRDNFFEMVKEYSKRKLESLNIPHRSTISECLRRCSQPDVYQAYVDIVTGNPPHWYQITSFPASFSMSERYSSVGMFLAEFGERIESAAREAVLVVNDG